MSEQFVRLTNTNPEFVITDKTGRRSIKINKLEIVEANQIFDQKAELIIKDHKNLVVYAEPLSDFVKQSSELIINKLFPFVNYLTIGLGSSEREPFYEVKMYFE